MAEKDFGAVRDPRFGEKGEGLFADLMLKNRLLEAEKGLLPEDLFPEEPIGEDETLILVARNAKDARPKDIEGSGSLNLEWAKEARETFLNSLEQGETKQIFEKIIDEYETTLKGKTPEVGELEPIAALRMFIYTLKDYFEAFQKINGEIEKDDSLSNEEKERQKLAATKSIMILVAASDVALITPKGETSNHKRGMETGQVKIDAIRKVLDVVGAEQSQLLNSTEYSGDTGPYPFSMLKDLVMFEQTPKNKEFVDWLKKESEARGINFWAAYEVDFDWVKSKRIEMGIEGPEEIADRISYAVSGFSGVARDIHEKNPASRVIFDLTTAYDTISPYAKSVMGMDKEDFLDVKYGGGVAILIDNSGNASTELMGNKYPVATDKVKK